MPRSVASAARALVAELGWIVTCNAGGWIRLWDEQGQHRGKRQGWPAAYAYLVAVADRRRAPEKAQEGEGAHG